MPQTTGVNPLPCRSGIVEGLSELDLLLALLLAAHITVRYVRMNVIAQHTAPQLLSLHTIMLAMLPHPPANYAAHTEAVTHKQHCKYLRIQVANGRWSHQPTVSPASIPWTSSGSGSSVRSGSTSGSHTQRWLSAAAGARGTGLPPAMHCAHCAWRSRNRPSTKPSISSRGLDASSKACRHSLESGEKKGEGENRLRPVM